MDNILNHNRIKARLWRTRSRLTRLALFDAFFLPLSLAIVFALLIASGVLSQVSEGSRALLVYGFVLLIILAFVRGVFRYRKPTRDEAKTRLDATDPERPLSSLADHPSKLTGETRAYWKKHREYLNQRALQLKSPIFWADWQRKDPLYLRFLLPVLLIGMLVLNSNALASRFGQAVKPDLGALFGANSLEVSAWITPPEYTGNAPVYLASAGNDVTVPAGSRMTFRVHGGSAMPKLRRTALDGSAPLQGPGLIPLKRAEDGAWQAEFTVSTSQTIELRYWGTRGTWRVDTTQDQLPDVQFVSDPEMGEDGKFSFRWEANDDYGLAEMALIISTIEESGIEAGQTERMVLDLPGAFLPNAKDTARLNLVRHKWAGLDVELKLEVTDTGGQKSLSAPVNFKLPEQLFLEPLAKASQEIRLTVLRENESYDELDEELVIGEYDGLGDSLNAAPDDVQRAALMLEAVTYRPEIFSDDITVYLSHRRAYEAIRGAREMSDLELLDNLLWSAALRSEFGTLADAARRLEAARRALERALREGASEEEIRRLMQAYRDAAEDYIAARMAEALQNGNQGGGGNPGGEPPNMVGGQDLEDMLNALEDLTETGATDAARQLLDDVNNLLNNLEFQRGNNGEGGMPFGEGESGEEQEEGTEEEQALEDALDRLSEILEDQRRLNDDTLQQRNGGGQSGQPQQPSIQNDPNSEDPFSNGETDPNGEMGSGGQQDEGTLAERQARIRDQLEAFADELGEDSGAGSGQSAEEFERAQRALDRAAEALRRGDLDGAQWNQDRAIQEMRDAAGNLAEELDAQRAQRRGETGEETVNEEDPLGRPAGGNRQNEGDGIEVPDEAERQRARDILDNLRERLNNADDEEEREYLKRLLDRFGS